LSFCFLKTEDITTNFSDSVFDWGPLVIRVNPSDILAQYLPTFLCLIIHGLNDDVMHIFLKKEQLCNYPSKQIRAECGRTRTELKID
jgi:hypothetical protein